MLPLRIIDENFEQKRPERHNLFKNCLVKIDLKT